MGPLEYPRSRTILLLCLLAACSKSRRGHAPDDPPGGLAVIERSLTLISPGQGVPRRLRYLASAGARETYELTEKATISRKYDQGPRQPPLEAGYHYLLDREVVSAAADGGFRLRLVVREVEARGASPDNAKLARALAGLETTIELDARGFARAASLTAPPGLPAHGLEYARDLAAGLQGLYPVLPDEPVAPGARWTVENDLHGAGLRKHERYQCELTSAQGDALDVRCKSDVTAPEQDARAPAGDSVRLTWLHGTGSQELEVHLRGPTIDGDGSSRETSQYDYRRGDRSVSVDDLRESSFELRRRSPP